MNHPILSRATIVTLALARRRGRLVRWSWRPGDVRALDDDAARARRETMVKNQLEARGIKDQAVLAAIRKVPRHRFVPEALGERAYEDGPLPIGEGQTISQPYIVAWMTELIEPAKGMRVLEIGTGSGYQAAVLAECVAEVDTIEVVPALGQRAERGAPRAGLSQRPHADRRRLSRLARPRAVRRDHPDRGTARRCPQAPARTAQGRRTAGRARRPRTTRNWSGSPGPRPGTGARCSRPCGSCP